MSTMRKKETPEKPLCGLGAADRCGLCWGDGFVAGLRGGSLGLKYWIGMMDGGINLPTVASGFIASNEFKTLYGANPTNDQFVSKLYNNVLGRAPDEGGFNYWVGLLNNKQIDMTSTLVNFSESTENQAEVIGVIQDGIDLFN